MIVTADWHLRDTPPFCWSGGEMKWYEAQREMVRFAVSSANVYKSDLYIVGDIYHRPLVSSFLSNMLLEELRKCDKDVYIMAGNHSLRNHREELADTCSIGALKYVGGNIFYVPAEEKSVDGRFEHIAKINDLLLVHSLIFEKEIPFGAKALTVEDVLSVYPTYSTVLLGDNHHSFVYRDSFHLVVNPGTPIIQTEDMVGTYEPAIYYIEQGQLIDVTTTHDLTPQFRRINHKVLRIPVPYDIMLYQKKERVEKKTDSSIESFVERLQQESDVSSSFEDNIQAVDMSEELRAFFLELHQEA